MAAAATPLRTEPSTMVPDHSLQLKNSRFLPPTPVSIPQPNPGVRSGHLNLDTFSPVNQNGSFEFDRVLKSGEVFKRTRKTKVKTLEILFS